MYYEDDYLYYEVDDYDDYFGYDDDYDDYFGYDDDDFGFSSVYVEKPFVLKLWRFGPLLLSSGVTGGFYLSSADYQTSPRYFRIGSGDLYRYDPTYFNTKEEAKKAAEAMGFTVEDATERSEGSK
ncbi:unnamed protein product [Sphagnum tenellum]